MKRRRKQLPLSTFDRDAAIGVGDVVAGCCQAALVGLLVLTPMLPTEGMAQDGLGVVLVVLWLLLWLATEVLGLMGLTVRHRWTPSDWVVVGLMAAHVASALVMGPYGEQRAMLNMTWQWVGMGVSYFLVRQWVREPRMVRAICAVCVSLAVAIAVFGYYEYAVTMPALRTAYEQDPEEMLSSQGIATEPDAPERKQFENRLASTEPMATFALTNSLAGFLTPWLVLLFAIGLQTLTGATPRVPWWCLGVVCAMGLAILGCLLLTKSRSAFLAVAAAAILVSAGTWQQKRGVARGQIVAVLVLGLLAVTALMAVIVVIGGLDPQVLSEAPRSIRYRLEYWYSSFQMIARYPWFGCGPGNFQSYYTGFKLPQASESVADPHNFVIEIWATTGIGGLVALLAGLVLMALLSAKAWRRVTSELPAVEAHALRAGAPANPSAAGAGQWTSRVICGGAVVGWLMIYPVGALSGFIPTLEVGGILLLVGGVCLAGLQPWVAAGRLPTWVLLAALFALGINLLAAGGISFAAVAQYGWLLWAMAVNQVADRAPAAPAVPKAGRGRLLPPWLARWAWVLVSAAIVIASLKTMYQPVLEARGWIDRVAATGPARLHHLQRAAEADPWSGRIAREQAQWLFLAWRQQPSATGWTAFVQAADQALAQDPHSASTAELIASCHQSAWEEQGGNSAPQAMLQAWTHVVQLYPQSNYYRACLANVLAITDHPERAIDEADRALKLDSRVPHQELKLSARTVLLANEPVPAEQRMRQIRNGLQ